MEIKTIFVNPCHGNGPYILGGNIAKRIAELIDEEKGYKPRIVMTHLYGKRQERIMQEEGLLGENVALDAELGKIYESILFGEEGFEKNLEDLLNNQQAAQEATRKRLREEYGEISLEINAGSQVTSGKNIPTALAYPSAYSELYKNTLATPELMKPIPAKLLEQVHDRMIQLEGDINWFFLPSYHTFSYDSGRRLLSKEISTPPLKPLSKRNETEIPANAVYVMLSGTGQEAETLLSRARKEFNGGNVVIVPQWAPDTGDNFLRYGPEVISNNNVKKVIARAGWGIIWTCQNAKTQLEHLPFTLGDEPEILFNANTLDSIPMLEATLQQEERFGTLDGIDFVAREIVKKIM